MKTQASTWRDYWRSPSLFWRTFLLIGLLLSLCLFGWYQFFVWFERAPRAHQFAQRIISVVNVTRAGLQYVDPNQRQALLAELSHNEGVRILPHAENDQVRPLPDRRLFQLMNHRVRMELGPETQIAGMVNSRRGFWVSFNSGSEKYWVNFPVEKFNRSPPLEWLSWGTLALLLSIIGAVILVRVINRPLARLTHAAQQLASGQMPAQLAPSGPAEIQLLMRAFNQMLDELEQNEQNRSLMLAGISHDLRTPMTRLRLELEMSALDEQTQKAMNQDIDQMEAIVRQFMDYARLQHVGDDAQALELRPLVEDTLAPYLNRAAEGLMPIVIKPTLEDVPPIFGQRLEITRLLDNLIENALRYGQTSPRLNQTEVEISLRHSGQEIILMLRDHGQGVPEHQLAELTQPFKRLNSARTDVKGSGLGLAIVERIIKRHQGYLKISNASSVQQDDHGLIFEIRLPINNLAPHNTTIK